MHHTLGAQFIATAPAMVMARMQPTWLAAAAGDGTDAPAVNMDTAAVQGAERATGLRGRVATGEMADPLDAVTRALARHAPPIPSATSAAPVATPSHT